MGKQSVYNYCIIAGILITFLQHVTATTESLSDKSVTQSTTFSSELTFKTSPSVNTDYNSPEDITTSATVGLKNEELQENNTTETLPNLSADINGSFTNLKDTSTELKSSTVTATTVMTTTNEEESPIPGLTSPATAGTTTENEKPFITPSLTTTSTADGATTAAAQKTDYSWIVIIVIVILIAAILVILIVCLVKNKDRRYSFDLYHKSPEDAGIPLNAVEREGTVEQISADANKDEKAVDNDTKPAKDSAATGGMAQAEKLGTAPADIEIPLDNANESNQKKEHDQCSLDLSEASLLTDVENVTNSKKAKTTDDGSSTHSAKTSQETLQDTQNDNNNNSNNVIVVGLQKGRLRKDLSRFPDDNPAFMVMAYRKNDSKQCSISEERQVMDYMPCTPWDMANQNDDIICIRITQKDNIEEGKRNWSFGQTGFSQDSTFTEVQLNQFE